MNAKTRNLFVSLALATVALFLIFAPLTFHRYGLYISSQWAVMTIAAIGLNLTLGYAGQISLAQGAFVGIGAYSAAVLTTHGWPLIAAIALALVLCFAIGWLLGYPALRVQHHYLAFVTLAFSTLAFLVFRNESWLTGGTEGIDSVPRPSLFGFSLAPHLRYYYFCLLVLALVTLATLGLARSPWGRAFIALRENPIRAMSLGVDTRRYILMAFAIGSALGGLAGALYAPLVGLVEPPAFALTLSFDLLMMVIVGGAGYFIGPFVGAMVAVLLPDWLRFLDRYYLLLYALLVMALLIYSPTGLVGIADRFIVRRRTKAASAARAALKASIESESA
jgi:branched-chain amino acid transport system permease protein